MFENLRAHLKGSCIVYGDGKHSGPSKVPILYTSESLKKELDEAEAQIKKIDEHRIALASFAADAQMAHQACEQELKAARAENERLDMLLKLPRGMIRFTADEEIAKLKDENAKLRDELARLKHDGWPTIEIMALRGDLAEAKEEITKLKDYKAVFGKDIAYLNLQEKYDNLCAKYQNLRNELHNLSK